MSSKQAWQTVAIGAVALVLALGLTIYTNQTLLPEKPLEQETPQTETISLTISGLYEGKQIKITSEETVLQVLQALNTEDPQLQLSTKKYSGLGVLVDGMHGERNGDDKKYWQYKVNGVMPQVGADAYKLKNGESVEWFFRESQF